MEETSRTDEGREHMSCSPPLDTSNVNVEQSCAIVSAMGDSNASIRQQTVVSQDPSLPNQSSSQQANPTQSRAISGNGLREDSSKSSLKELDATVSRVTVQSNKKAAANLSQRNSKSISHRSVPLLNDFKSLVPSGSAQQQVLQQQALHQAALHQQGLKQHGLQSMVFHPTSSHPQQPQQLASHRQGYSKKNVQKTGSPQSSLTQQASPMCNWAAKVEPMEVDRASALDRASYSGPQEPADSGHKKGVEVESKASVPSGTTGEAKEPELSRRSQDERVHGLCFQADSGVRTAREGVFADLNAEPPVSEGEDAAPSEDLPSNAQPECSRTTPDEKRRRKKQLKDGSVKDGEEDSKRTGKSGKSRSKSKGELISEPGQDCDMDSQLVGVPTTREEKTKSLKAGLIHVARKMPKNAHAHFALGLMYQRLGQPTKAAPAFQKSVEILKQTEEECGQNRTQLLALAQTHYAQCLLQGRVVGQASSCMELQGDEFESLVAKLKESVQADSGQVSIWNTLGLMLLRNGENQSAISVFTSLLSAVPDYLDALANLGVAYLHSGYLEHAARCFQSLLAKDSSHPGGLINYGALLLRQYSSTFAGAGAGAGQDSYAVQFGAAIAAQQCLITALKADPKAGHIWVNLAAAYAASGNFSSASRCLEQASKLEPTRMSTRYAVAMHRVRDSQRSHDSSEQLSWAANEMASILREGDPTTIQSRLAWAGLAMVNRAQHETAAAFEGVEVDLKEVEERALHTLQQAIEENPDDAVQWHQLGLHTLCTLQFRAAQNYLKTAIARRQTCATAWSNLGIALQLSDDPSFAEPVYNRALSLVTREQAHSILSNLGNLYRQQKRFGEAHEAFKQALELCPDYAPACNNLGLLLIAEGRWQDAIATFDRALHADPFLDAAKSNKMKAEALAQIHGDNTTTHLVQENEIMLSEKAMNHSCTPSESSSIMEPAANCFTSATHSASSPHPSSPQEKEPFPLPSTS